MRLVMSARTDDWGRLEVVDHHGAWIPNGLTAAEIAKGADAIESRFDLDKNTARSIAITVLQAVRAD